MDEIRRQAYNRTTKKAIEDAIKELVLFKDDWSIPIHHHLSVVRILGRLDFVNDCIGGKYDHYAEEKEAQDAGPDVINLPCPIDPDCCENIYRGCHLMAQCT